MDSKIFAMLMLVSKTFTTIEELQHEEKVLCNEALRMNASSDLLQSIKEQIEKRKAELDKLKTLCNNVETEESK